VKIRRCSSFAGLALWVVLGPLFRSPLARAGSDVLDGLMPFSEHAKIGFKDDGGTAVIPPRFDEAKLFRQGVAAVRQGKLWGLIDVNGTMLVPPTFDVVLDGSSEGLIPVAKDGKWSFIDRHGARAFDQSFSNAGGFAEGYACVEIAGKWGFIDRTGKLVIQPAFDLVMPFSEGLAAVAVAGKWGYIDATGKARIPLQFEWAGSFSAGFAAVNKDSKTGFIDTSATVVIPFHFESASVNGFSEGLCAARAKGKWGLINFAGDWVVEPKYDKVTDCCSGTAVGKLNGRYTVIYAAEVLRRRKGEAPATSPATRPGH